MRYILFSAEDNVSISALHRWDGIIEYSYDNQTWQKWNGEKIINNKIYMRGINNIIITAVVFITVMPWVINGNNIKCQGNIENLLDYKSVINNMHPKMGRLCFSYMFASCNLIEAPQLPSVALSPCCYLHMFEDCKLLTTSPTFPNLQIAKEAIINQEIFYDCHLQFININNKLYDANIVKLFPTNNQNYIVI